MPKPDLDNAYSLKSPADARRLYADWAETYDTTFAEAMDFVLPQRVAQAFFDAGGTGPVLDFGTGTGLVGKELARLGIAPVDGVDLSPEMLDVARGKCVYRHLYEGDILSGAHIAAAPYSGVVSSGTFTLGHVGPDAIAALLDLACPGAQFALSINNAHFDAAGFDAAFVSLSDRITDLRLPEFRYYGDQATGAHKNDVGKIALFRKIGT